MCGAFAAMEGVHQTSYAYLGDTLGLDDYKAFLEEPTARSKIDRLVSAPRDANDHDVAVSLASFSAFGEGVSLFSSFAVLLHFSTRNMLKGTGQIISFSIRDESLHSEAGCWLFKEFMAEDPSLFSKRLVSDIKEVARETVRLEENAIDQIFDGGALGSFTPEHLKAFIKLRANKKLQEIGVQSIFGKIDEQAVAKTMGWFDAISAGREHADFFATRVTEYGTTDGNWEEIW
jgi:ribonucleoside-diphosphate reductase beta chain